MRIPPSLFNMSIFLALLVNASAACAEDLPIPGSGNPEYVLAKLAESFNALQSRHRVTVPPSSGTAGALRDVEAGTASLGRISRPLTGEERDKGIRYLSLGRDPVVFAAGAEVSVRAISAGQVVDVYTGRITDWRELGGRPGPIRAIGREITDASRRAVSRIVKPFENIVFGENVKVVHLDPQMIELLDRYPTSLGFINRSALRACKTRIVQLAFDGSEPTKENMIAGRYPLWLEFGLIYKPGALTPAGKAFLEFVASPPGVRILLDNGVAPTLSGS